MPDFNHIENAHRMLAADEATSIVGAGWKAERSGTRVVITIDVTAQASAAEMARPYPAIVEHTTT